LHIAHELAAEGINIVLIACNEDRLAETASDFCSKYPDIDTRTVSFDAGQVANLDPIRTAIQGLAVSLLFNNVGVQNIIPTNVEDMDAGEVSNIVSTNCTFQAQLTSLVIPQLRQYVLVRSNEQGRALVVTVSSLTSRMAMPMLAVYAATKAFEEHFSLGLAAELQPLGIDCMCLRPWLTGTMSGSDPSLFYPSAQVMGRACVRMVGCGELSVAPYAPHAVLDAASALLPYCASFSLVRQMHEKKRQEKLRHSKK